LAHKKNGLEYSCHQLKHELATAQKLYDQIFQLIVVDENIMEKLQASITYFRNHLSQMQYSFSIPPKKLPDWLWCHRSSLQDISKAKTMLLWYALVGKRGKCNFESKSFSFNFDSLEAILGQA